MTHHQTQSGSAGSAQVAQARTPRPPWWKVPKWSAGGQAGGARPPRLRASRRAPPADDAPAPASATDTARITAHLSATAGCGRGGSTCSRSALASTFCFSHFFLRGRGGGEVTRLEVWARGQRTTTPAAGLAAGDCAVCDGRAGRSKSGSAPPGWRGRRSRARPASAGKGWAVSHPSSERDVPHMRAQDITLTDTPPSGSRLNIGASCPGSAAPAPPQRCRSANQRLAHLDRPLARCLSYHPCGSRPGQRPNS